MIKQSKNLYFLISVKLKNNIGRKLLKYIAKYRYTKKSNEMKLKPRVGVNVNRANQ